jgi:hypothetical protein
LVSEDVVLRFQVWNLDSEDIGEGRLGVGRGKEWVVVKELSEARSRKRVYGGDVKGGTDEAMGRRELRGEEKGEQ